MVSAPKSGVKLCATIAKTARDTPQPKKRPRPNERAALKKARKAKGLTKEKRLPPDETAPSLDK